MDCNFLTKRIHLLVNEYFDYNKNNGIDINAEELSFFLVKSGAVVLDDDLLKLVKEKIVEEYKNGI